MQVWYSAASWEKPVWYSLTVGTVFDDVMARLEKVNVEQDNPYDPDVYDAGIYGYTVADEVIARLEK
jgi:hypothetical protein